MKTSEIRKLEQGEMNQKLSELENQYFQLKFEGRSNGIKKPHELKTIRQVIARIKTVKNENRNK